MVGIKEIAEELGLSRHTVSDVLNCGDKRYSEKTIQRIHEAAERMGYRPNRVAQSLRLKRTKSIGILNFSALHELGAMKLQKVLQEVAKTGYYPLVTNGQWHLDGCRGAIGQLIEARVSGVLMVNPSFRTADEFSELRQLLNNKIPVVAMGGEHLRGIPRFLSNKELGFYQMTRHLVEQGYKRITLLVRGKPADPAGMEIMANWHTGAAARGYRRCLQEFGRDKLEDIVTISEEISSKDSEYDNDPYINGYKVMKKALSRDLPRPDAVICSNDSWAYGVLRVCKEEGIAVPQQMALCGFEDELSSRYGILSLTTFRHPLNELARRSVEHLMGLVKAETLGEERLEVISGELIIRESSLQSERVVRLGQEKIVTVI